MTHEQPFPELRAQVRELCAGFPDEYWRERDQAREYPQAFVDTLTERRAARRADPDRVRRPRARPHRGQRDHGGDQPLRRALRGLPRADVHDGRAAAARQRSAEAAPTCPAIAERRAAPAGLLDHRGRRPARTPPASPPPPRRDGDDVRHRPATRTGPAGSSSPTCCSCSPAPAQGRHDPRPQPVPGRPAQVRAEQPDALEVTPVRTMFNYATNQVHYRGLRVPADQPDRRGGPGLPLRDRRLERRAHPAGRRGHRRRLLVHRARHRLRQRARGLRPPDRRQPGRAVPARRRLHAGPRRRPDALRGRAAASTRASPAAPRPTWPSSSPPRRAGPPPTPAWTPTAATASSTTYDVERKFRETRLYQVAPVNNNLVTSFVATKVLGLPRSY